MISIPLAMTIGFKFLHRINWGCLVQRDTGSLANKKADSFLNRH
jgi:hypothetical protein